MNKQARKFCCDEQKVQDIIRAIDVIQPVIGLIRELEKTEQSLKLIREKKERIDKEIGSVNTTMILYKDKYGMTSDNLDNLFNSLTDERNKLHIEEKAISSNIEELHEVICYEYLEYANSFREIKSDIAQEVVGVNDPTWSIDKFLAMFLILFNKGLDKEKREEIFEEISLNWQESLQEEMQILKQTEGEQDKIVLYIRQN